MLELIFVFTLATTASLVLLGCASTATKLDAQWVNPQHAGKHSARLVAGKDTEPFVYHDKGTMATIGRGAAVIQTHGGRTVKGRAASLAWGAVHLALLSTGEDRAKAVVDWTWAGFTHERPGRISVRTEQD